jgi:hypothetical protein
MLHRFDAQHAPLLHRPVHDILDECTVARLAAL